MMNQWNIRVYVFAIYNNHFLVLHEPFSGKMVNKLPGGGVEFGESPINTINREFQEEFGIILEQKPQLVYVDEWPQVHPVHQHQQLLTMYYKLSLHSDKITLMDDSIKNYQWLSFSKESEQCLDLPFDKRALNFLIND
jgi:8-oxo-dGTP diphosphatase